ncbi:tRNA (adenosine(37)-N6)-dimethylallyltransferase MiaA [Patescibacteria group bacterium]|nr:tRNA (adenosine(37)-N6)-dimethylallyltransferase MiaA [Patescibacteria group bacterium]
MNKLLVLCGPTATGKTKLALGIAAQYNGELVSADSRQVYKGLSVLTGKDLPAHAILHKSDVMVRFRKKPWRLWYYGIDDLRLWMYDVARPETIFSTSQYQVLGRAVIASILARGKLPILVGGTGLYITSILHELDTLHIPPDMRLRRRLHGATTDHLMTELVNIDRKKYDAMNTSDRHNPRRLVRAIEVARWQNRHGYHAAESPPAYDVLSIGLDLEDTLLRERIRQRVLARLEDAIQEVKKLPALLTASQLPISTSLGISMIRSYLAGNCTREELIEQWSSAEFRYAQRQRTWFARVPGIRWVDMAKNDAATEVMRMIGSWYTGAR